MCIGTLKNISPVHSLAAQKRIFVAWCMKENLRRGCVSAYLGYVRTKRATIRASALVRAREKERERGRCKAFTELVAALTPILRHSANAISGVFSRCVICYEKNFFLQSFSITEPWCYSDTRMSGLLLSVDL